MLGSIKKAWVRGPLAGLALTFIFALSFCLPVWVLFQLGERAGLWQSFHSGSSNSFAESIPIESDGQFLRVTHSDQLNPRPEKDFLLVSWFLIRKAPPLGVRLVLLSKYRSVSGSPRFGYGLAIEREQDGYRPTAFWGSTRGGRWYEFPAVSLRPHNWFGLGLSFHDGRFIGVHLLRLPSDAGGEVTLLGGYDLGEGAGVDMGNADLITGAALGRPFRGRIGALTIISKKGLSADLKRVLKEMVRSPGRVPWEVNEKDLRLYVNEGRRDSSSYRHQVEFITR